MDTPSSADSFPQWRAPDQGGFKINCDVAIKRNGQEAVVGAVMRDWEGSLVDGNVAFVRASSPLQGELLAIRQACGMVRSLGLNEAVIESDNQQAIKLSVSELVPPWEVMALVMDIRQIRQEADLKLVWARREANGLAHVVATMALKNLLPCNWVGSPPSFVSAIVARELCPVL